VNADLHIVLYEPEIPPNTGNIARRFTCKGENAFPSPCLGFNIDDKQLKRAGLDYWPHLNVREHEDWSAVRNELQGHRWFGLSTKGGQTIWQTRFEPGDVLVMGPETRGLPHTVLADIQSLRIPMRDDAPVRSLNLSSACAIATYEALRQLDT